MVKYQRKLARCWRWRASLKCSRFSRNTFTKKKQGKLKVRQSAVSLAIAAESGCLANTKAKCNESNKGHSVKRNTGKTGVWRAVCLCAVYSITAMNLNRHQLIHATDKQLRTIGVVRTGNSGWLRKSLLTQYTAAQVASFIAADTRSTASIGKTVAAQKLINDCSNQFKNLLLSIRAGEMVSAQDHAQQILSLLKRY